MEWGKDPGGEVTLLRLRFPLGRYHATGWDRHVNEGVPEWPPSPWRIARALFSVWKERCPELDQDAVVAALTLIGQARTYHLPPSVAATTRHYYPGPSSTGPRSNTSKILDPFVALHHDAALDVILPASSQKADGLGALEHLAGHLTYLGRADSVCDAELLDTTELCTSQPFAPDPAGDLRLPVPLLPLDLDALTVTTDALRKCRLASPPGVEWISYPTPAPFDPEPARSAPQRPPQTPAVLLSVQGRPAPPLELAVAVADAVARAAQSRYGRLTAGGTSPVLSGHEPGGEVRSDQHTHVHWIPLGGSQGRIDRIVVWAPEGLSHTEIAALAALQEVRPPMRQEANGSTRSVIRGFSPIRVAVARLGKPSDVALGLVAPDGSRMWESLTPFVPPRRQKRRHIDGRWIGPYALSFVEEEVNRELAFRKLPPARVSEGTSPTGRPSQRYRRFRRRLADAKSGVWLRLELTQPVKGPVAIGALSHFGLGVFRPVRSDRCHP